MIPLRDELTSRRRPLVTVLLIAANVLAFLYQLSLGRAGNERLVTLFGAVPAFITGAAEPQAAVPGALTVLTAMFLHGGFLHLAGNMLFLWIFGDNVEDTMGRFRFLVFYLLCGAAAAFGQISVEPASRLPMIGASGAISGVMGAYMVMFPRSRIMTLVFFGFFVQVVRVPALFFLAFWFLLQFLYGSLSLGAPGAGVAWFAHVGGFLGGLALVFVFRRRSRLAWYRRH